MSKLRVNDVLGEDGVSAVGFSKGAVVTGVCTATTFSGNLTGSSSGLTGTPNITINNLTGVAATFTGAVAIGGTLTYEDVVNVDSVGIITARAGVYFGTAGAGTKITGVANSITVEGGASSVNLQFKETSGAYQRLGIVKDNDKLQLGEFNNDGTTFTSIFAVTGDGDKVGLGTVTPSYLQHNYHLTENVLALLQSGGGASIISFQDNASDNNTSVWVGSQGNDLRLTAGGGEKVRIAGTGKVYFQSGPLVEKSNNHSSATLSSLQNDGHVNLLSGNVIKFTGNETDSTCTINFRGNGSTTLASLVSIGDNVAVTVILDPNGAGLITTINIDAHAQTIEWSGGSAPTAGAASTWDIYSINLFRTGSGNTDWLVTASCTNYA